MSDLNPELPVNAVLEVLQTSAHPELSDLPWEVWARIENCLRDDVEKQLTPKIRPSMVQVSTCFFWAGDTFETDFEKIKALFKNELEQKARAEAAGEEHFKTGALYIVRKISLGDTFEISELGPQVISLFFDGDVNRLASMTSQEQILEVFSKIISGKAQAVMHVVAMQLLELLTALVLEVPDLETLNKIINRKVKIDQLESLEVDCMSAQDLIDLGPEAGYEALLKVVSINTDFFTYVQSKVPEGFKTGLASLTGMITKPLTQIGLMGSLTGLQTNKEI